MNCLKYSKQKLKPGKGVSQWQQLPLQSWRGNTQPTPPLLTFNALLAPEGQGITCTFCKQEHKLVDCVVVTNVSERNDILKKQGRCFICLKRFHIAKNCDSKRDCSNRSQRHHSSLFTSNETPASGNSAAGVTQPSTQES